VEPRADKPGLVRTAAALLVVAAISAVGFLDYVTGPWVSFALLYVVPVLAAAWFLGRGPALLAGLTAGIAWFEAEALNRRGVESRADLLWNSSTRLLMLIAMAWMVVRIRDDRRRLREVNSRLGELLTASEQLARTDPLTSLPNRRAFFERMGDELARAKRSGQPIVVAYLDIDNFKVLNDRRGHGEGDEFLRRVAATIRDTIRQSDVAARIGGDVFAVLFVEAKRDSFEALAQRLLARVRALGEAYPSMDVGASIGMAWFEKPPDSPEALLQRADRAMYEAKRMGKHRFVLSAADA
jgi:diguanylate cyclase (GGDEF)-like protein